MRLGGSIIQEWKTPAEWAALVREMGYSAVIFPVNSSAPKTLIREIKERIDDAGWVIGEVGIWKNLMDPEPAEREKAMTYAIRQLELAEEVGANCCVNISGSHSTVWDGYHPENYSEQTHETIIRQTQRIIDAVRPTHTAYSLEPMPWMLPDSPDSCLQLMKEVDRNAFKVHLDFCNMINSLERYHQSDRLIDECFEKLGPYIRSIHIKDCRLNDEILPFSVAETRVGTGCLKLERVLLHAEQLSADIPLFTEHLLTQEDYRISTRYLKELAQNNGITVR